MKSIFFHLTLLLCTLLTSAQTNQTDANGKKHGLWKGIYEGSNRPRYEGTFDHGKETGTFKYFDDTKEGKVVATREFRPDGSAYNIFFDQKGNKVSEGLLVNKLYEGDWKYYHEASKDVMTLEKYKSGKLNGIRTVYYKSGKVAETAEYKDGKRNGPYRKFAEDKDSTPLEEVTYLNGQVEGDAVYYNPDGTIASKGKYVNGEKKGTWEFYRDGKLFKKEKYPLNKKFIKTPRANESDVLGN
ncbi:toxin-antitoxin system YwqK family antitoxin [Flavobacterium silvaticum]|uniref:Toxin-antitoxin system YwqK family antitoxin n=1 Tax=Flavobacterium silvaticum TaxID=1852020 RepID=A0A972FME0_9FLAO|nr:hypothetical protein [Flavobacterium silvaticum]NMH27880.1 hypothetical protein [Flavobacterium silvaticum]